MYRIRELHDASTFTQIAGKVAEPNTNLNVPSHGTLSTADQSQLVKKHTKHALKRFLPEDYDMIISALAHEG